MPVIGIREFSSKISKYIGEVERSGHPVIVTRHGRPAVAMLPIDVDRLQALTVAAAPRLVHDLERANADLAAGRSRSLDEVLAELDQEQEATTQVEHLSGQHWTTAVRVGDEFPTAKVVKTTTFGAFIELAKDTDGLLHIMSIAPGQRPESVEDMLNRGDEVAVRVVEVDEEWGHIGLSLVDAPEVHTKSAEELA